jgi:hypothetical protein
VEDIVTRYLNWYGRVALFGPTTSDGRVLTDLFDDRLPVPVLYRHNLGDRVNGATWTVGEATRLRSFRSSFGTRPGAAWVNLRLDLDMLPTHLEHSLYPEIDVDDVTVVLPHEIRGTLTAVWLGTLPAWPSLKPVIEVEE